MCGINDFAFTNQKKLMNVKCTRARTRRQRDFYEKILDLVTDDFHFRYFIIRTPTFSPKWSLCDDLQWKSTILKNFIPSKKVMDLILKPLRIPRF
jgi:hypothetical protein